MLLTVVSFFAGTTASADIKTAPKLDIRSSSTIIGSEYTFVPQVTSETELVTFGSTLWRNTRWDNTDNRVFRSIELTNPTLRNNLKGNIGAKYTNVGHYKGESVDLKITLTNWSRHGLAGTAGTAARVGNISFERNNIALSTQGYNFVDMTWEYVKSGTNTRLPVSGYFTYSDIDVNQGLEFSAITSHNIDRYMIDNRWNRLQYLRTVNNSDRFYDIDDVDRIDTVYDDRYAFTFLYSDLSSFSIRWMTNWANTTRTGQPVTPERYFYGNTRDYATGEYLFFIINKPARTEMSNPVKTVTPGSGYTIDQPLNYKVSHTVPQEDPTFYYSRYVIEDQLDSVLINPTVVIRNSAGRNMNAWFDRDITDNKITYTAKSTTLNNSNFYGDTYTLEISAGVSYAGVVNAVGSNNNYPIHNRAIVRTNNGTYQSNRVTTNIAARTLTVQHVDDATGDVLSSSTRTMFDGQRYTVRPRNDLTNDAGVAYSPTSNSVRTGTINGANATVVIRYALPNENVGIENILIYTDKVASGDDAGLPTVVDIAANVDEEVLADSEVDLKVFDVTNDKEVYTETYSVSELTEAVEFLLPTDYLAKDDKVDYEFRLTTASDSGLASTTPVVETHGYTSSEKHFTATDLNGDREIDYTGVIRTEKSLDEDVIELDERVVLSVPELVPQKTGYGLTATVDASYINDLEDLVDIQAAFRLDSALIDSHLDYPASDGMTRIDMDRTERSVAMEGQQVLSKLELPFVNVERYTGNLFTNEQVAAAGADAPDRDPVAPEHNPDPTPPPAPVEIEEPPLPAPPPFDFGEDDGVPTPSNPIEAPGTPVGPGPMSFLDSVLDAFSWSTTVSAAEAAVIRHEALDGGRKLYAPIWAQVGDYPYAFTSRESIGVHAVTFDIEGELDIFAHMFNHNDSITPDTDELLVHPVRPEDVPLDWHMGAPDERP